MKRDRFALLVPVALLFVACGGSGGAPVNGNINGTWSAQLAIPDGVVLYSFSSTLTQGNGSAVSVSNLSFSPAVACFPAPTVQTATFTVTGNVGGVQTGTFGMSISAAGSEAQNTLTLTGARTSSGWISGTWTLVGVSGCTGHGSYVMKPASTA